MLLYRTTWHSFLLFGRRSGINLELNGLTVISFSALTWLLYSLFNRSLMLWAVTLVRLWFNCLLPDSRCKMQGWSPMPSLRPCLTTFWRPVTTNSDLWLSWFDGIISSLYWNTSRFILLMIPTHRSWGCAFRFDKKFNPNEKTSFLVHVSLYTKWYTSWNVIKCAIWINLFLNFVCISSPFQA